MVFNLVIVLLVRILAFYTIRLIFNLNQTSNFIIAIVVSFIIFFIEIATFLKRK